jgi:hypothetical protein
MGGGGGLRWKPGALTLGTRALWGWPASSSFGGVSLKAPADAWGKGPTRSIPGEVSENAGWELSERPWGGAGGSPGTPRFPTVARLAEAPTILAQPGPLGRARSGAGCARRSDATRFCPPPPSSGRGNSRSRRG